MKVKPKIKKQITGEEQKQLQISMLEFVDKICRKNNIKYSAIGGTLIGAIRHKGFIPWDDDIDIILTKNNYDKLKRILDKETGRYRTLKYGQGGECFSFTKLIDTNTHLMEKRQLNYNPNYGVYIDIFCYYPAPNDKEAQKEMYSKLRFLNKIMARGKIKYDTTFINKVKRLSKNILSRLYGYNRINKLTKEYANKYVGKNTDYVMSDWLVYSLDQEVQLRKNTKEYIDAKFENLSIMIFKNYNEILRATFGDYMKLPPKSERIPKHDLIAWWKEGNE